MNRLGTTLAGAVCAGVLALGFWGVASAEETAAAATPATPAAPAAHQYVGAKKCKMCHNAEKGGAQFTKWTESKHAKALETLGSEEAKKIAAEKKIADPATSAECLSCHQTGYGEPADHLAASYVAEGVTCESCHGAGADYIKMKTMAGIRDKSLKAEDYGLVMPTKETCEKCHNDKSPTFKSFDFAEYSKKIEHKIPEGYKRGGASEEAK